MASASARSSAGVPASLRCADNFFRVQALSLRNALLLKNGGEDDSIGEAEAFNEIGRENLAAQRVGARLEHGPKATRRIDGAECTEGFADGGGVMGKVLDEGDAVDFCADFETALDAFEGGESFGDGGGGNARRRQRGLRRQWR